MTYRLPLYNHGVYVCTLRVYGNRDQIALRKSDSIFYIAYTAEHLDIS